MTPYLLLAFANDQDSPERQLRNLPEEWREIQKALKPAVAAGRCRLVELPFATAGDLFDVFQRDEHRGRIALLHFAGHADSYQLLLEDTDGASAEVGGAGLAEFLGHASGLQVVFLNGCATQGHVQGLLDAGVSAVIATSRAVDDSAARDFAVRFYKGLGEAIGLREAFEQAVATLRSTRPGTDGTHRHLYTAAAPEDDRIPWELSVREGAERVELWTPGTPPLPPVPRRDLPERPFRHLQRFSGEHAELFFGREREIWELHGRVVSPDAPPVVLLYGQAGVGKSSLLDAGLLPRLEGTQQVRYARRDAALGLTKTLARAVGVDDSSEAGEITAAWRRIETESEQPLLVIVDQVEEAFTRTDDPQAELTEFAHVLGELFRDRGRRPRGKLVLGFRKEWLAEVESALREAEVSRKAQFLPRLRREGVIAAITGVERDRRLCEHYGLSIEEGLPERIAADLLRDEDSHLAPLLQILLSAMWDAALERDRSHPRFDNELYETLTLYHEGQEGKLLLDDFVGQQLTALGASQPAALESGLALDFLAFHTTRYGTARERSGMEGAREYPRQVNAITGLRRELTDLYLLTDSPADTAEPAGTPDAVATRLAHDTLAPLVRRRFEESDAPGQRARRILEARATDWTGGRTGTPLDGDDLAVVERGAEGMRTWSGDEERLVEASRTKRAKELRARSARRMAAAVGGVMVLTASLFAFVQWRRSEQRTALAESRALAIQAALLREDRPEISLLLSVAAYERNSTPEARAALGAGLAGMSPRVRSILRSGLAVVRDVALSPDGERLATAEQDGSVILWDVPRGQAIDTLVLPRVGALDVGPPEPRVAFGSTGVAFSPNGKWLATHGTSVELWDAANLAPRGTLRTHRISTFAFSPDGHTLAAIVKSPRSGVILRDIQTRRERLYDPPGSAVALAFGPDWLAIGQSDGSVILMDIASETMIPSGVVGEPVVGLSVSVDGTYLAVASENSLTIWETRTWTSLVLMPLRRGAAGTMKFVNERILVFESTTGFELQDVAAHTGERLRAHLTPITSVTVSRNGKTFASSDSSGMVVIWQLGDRAPWRTHPGVPADAPSPWYGVALSPTGESLAVADSAGVVWWDLMHDRKQMHRFPSSGNSVALAFSGDGRRLAFANDTALLTWALEERTATPLVVARVSGVLALDHTGRLIAGRTAGGVTLVPTGGRGMRQHVRSDSLVLSLAFDQSGRWLALGGIMEPVFLQNIARRTGGRSLLGHRGPVTSLAFSRDGRLLASGDNNGAILLWDLSHEHPVGAPLSSGTEPILALAFDPSGRSLTSGNQGGTVALWDVAGRRLLSSSIREHGKAVVGVSFVGADSVIVSADRTGVVERTNVSTTTWVERACRIANWEALRQEWGRRVVDREFPRACRRPSASAGARPAR